jgi:hypothetical protein
MSYSELIASKATLNSIRGWINWDMTPAVDILAEAETFVYSSLRVREMKRTVTGTLATGVTQTSLPPDFIAPRSFKRIGPYGGKIEILDDKMFEDCLPLMDDGTYPVETPTKCTIQDDPPVALLNTRTDTQYPYRLVYWRRPESLDLTNETNFLTRRYPILLRATCLGYAHMFMKNAEQSDKWLGVAGTMINQANSDYDLGEQANRVENYWET